MVPDERENPLFRFRFAPDWTDMPTSKPSFDDYAHSEDVNPTTAFPILRTNSYGRMMICAQMNTHDRLIRNAKGRTDCFISKVKPSTASQ
jgi:hypothetical protein